ncbi:probable F420-dependent oxidoreductase, MSMEG_2516 family [Sinosporangium album]|uniref:Probable F420-dependent oxidoreductase, MSMEG_2516 family n=1 Tax=Sinosporangium album TaxID=504805 RepID=A0A1G7YER2_9ACTN|nr:TIGR03621 family F420-dependent LLM class oxidoreductase [Sinosporangium album]SDG94807.1 probable F420-dependent oxidoreductase, MSMEG_2516 family [Sinosporangium album]
MYACGPGQLRLCSAVRTYEEEFVGALPLRFGICLFSATADQWAAKSRAAEESGYDVIAMTDVLGFLPPFQALAIAATSTTRSRLATYAINPALWNHAVLAREILGSDQFSGGRLELGLSAGFPPAQYRAAGVEYADTRARLDTLADALATLKDTAAESGRRPPRVLIAAREEADLDFAAEHADTVALVGAEFGDGGTLRLLSADILADQVKRIRSAPSGDTLELNLAVKRVVVTGDREATAAALRPETAPHLTDEEFLDLPHVLIGTHRQIADRLRDSAERYGFTYITVTDEAADDFAPVIRLLRAG